MRRLLILTLLVGCGGPEEGEGPADATVYAADATPASMANGEYEIAWECSSYWCEPQGECTPAAEVCTKIPVVAEGKFMSALRFGVEGTGIVSFYAYQGLHLGSVPATIDSRDGFRVATEDRWFDQPNMYLKPFSFAPGPTFESWWDQVEAQDTQRDVIMMRVTGTRLPDATLP